MQVIYDAGWSAGPIGFSNDVPMDAKVLAKLGLGLRSLYRNLTEEPVPESLALLIRELEKCELRLESP